MQRLFLGTAVAVAALAASNGSAQTRVGHAPGASFPRPGVQPVPAYRPTPGYRPVGSRPGTHVSRWGSKVGGHWWGGVNAPGGWGAYRRPARGYVLPRYWVAPRFYVTDWAGYGLAQPPVGYSWSRYYDDAVLIDDRGSIYDTVSGVDWDGEGDAYDDGYAASVYEDRGYERDRRDTGLGGAAVGAVAGGVAGNLIAGRGNRLGGTLIGAGVGAAAGYALDKSEDRGRGYRPAPGARGYAPYYPPQPYAPPAYPGYRPNSWTSPDGATTVVATSAGGHYGAGTTTVTVQSAPVVTTTTTTYEDVVTYSRPHRVNRKRWAARPRCACK
ncbi:RcnB family protein [Sphingomonas aerophila]|uniref:17 kDa surface antigen n=1 Tax=Sphingomonas aerophila TaxID=1344948 RepID=A0A7W9BEL0_9SPHN|nr:RcnB family protein [Sphingomonas aerophila]MBB5715743.1 Ni/Co efflux regulator RcnB [Sphingomonas aerophila]